MKDYTFEKIKELMDAIFVLHPKLNIDIKEEEGLYHAIHILNDAVEKETGKRIIE